MATTITFDLSRSTPVGPVLTAIETEIDSAIVPMNERNKVTKLLNVGPTQVVYTFPDSIGLDQVSNVFRKCVLEFGLLGRVSQVVSPVLSQALSFATTDQPAHGQPV